MLVGSDVSWLFSKEEKDSIIIDLRQKKTDYGSENSKEAIWKHFSLKAARDLHVILVMSPVRTICEFITSSFIIFSVNSWLQVLNSVSHENVEW